MTTRPGITYYLGGDAGLTGDSFTLAVFHVVPPSEGGSICPACFANRARRRVKHYRVAKVNDSEAGPCDHCGTRPSVEQQFWGISRRSGREVQRPVVKSYGASGDPIYETEEVLNPITSRLETRVRVETVFLPLVVQDLLLEWVPDKRRGLVVDFESVTQVIMALYQTGQLGY